MNSECSAAICNRISTKIESAVGFAYDIFCRVFYGENMPPHRQQRRRVARGDSELRRSVDRRLSNHKVSRMYNCEMIDFSCHGPSSSPHPRSGHRIVCDDSNLWCFGGYNPHFLHRHPFTGLMSEVWQFNFATRKWTKLDNGENCPAEAASHSMILCGESLIVWGGTGFPFGERCSNQLHAFHIPTKVWHQLQCGGEIPSGRYGQSMTLKDGNIYIIGGTTGHNYSMGVHRLNLETLHWDTPTRVNVMDGFGDENPRPRYRHEAVTYGSRLFILGGGTADRAFDFDRIPIYDTATKSWTAVQSTKCPNAGCTPPARRFHAAVQYEQYAYICGGFHGRNDGDSSIIFDDIWRLDLIDLQWTKMKQRLPIPTYFHSASVTPQGCLYSFGGVITPNGDTRSNSVFKMWLTVPPLEEIAWNAITDNNNKFFAKSKPEDLRAAGVILPNKFFRRLM